jgi:uncharacterized protein YndB with AHSA1/START domain
MTFGRASMVPGGDAVFAMTNGAFTMYGRFHYDVIEPPHRLEYTQVFVDEYEQLARYPGDGAWPETMYHRVQLTSEGPTQTRVTIRTSIDRRATPPEVSAFVAERGGMTQGWTGSFDKLEALLTPSA